MTNQILSEVVKNSGGAGAAVLALYYFLSFAVGVVGSSIMWWFKLKKNKAEIIKLAGDHLQRKQDAQRTYMEANSECAKSFDAVYKLINAKAPPSEVDLARTKVCETLVEKTIGEFSRYIEWEELSNSDANGLRVLIEDDVIPELRRYAKWMSVINHDSLLKYVGRTSKQQIRKSEFTPFKKLVKKLSLTDQKILQPLLDDAISKIIHEGL